MTARWSTRGTLARPRLTRVAAALLVLALPAAAHGQIVDRIRQAIMRRHSAEEIAMAADAVEHALTIPATIGAQRFDAAGRCRFELVRRLGVDSAHAPAEIFLVDAGDLLLRTRVEQGPRGVSQLWAYAASKGGVVRYGSDVRKRYLDSFPILLGPTADRAAVAERERRFREFLAACEWRF